MKRERQRGVREVEEGNKGSVRHKDEGGGDKERGLEGRKSKREKKIRREKKRGLEGRERERERARETRGKGVGARRDRGSEEGRASEG